MITRKDVRAGLRDYPGCWALSILEEELNCKMQEHPRHVIYVILNYLQSQRQQQQTLKVNKGEYQCPLCRQLSNTALPMMPEEGAAVTTPLPTSELAMVHL